MKIDHSQKKKTEKNDLKVMEKIC